MLESVLARRGASLKVKITVKSLVALGVVALAVLLPQLVHLAAGASGGVRLLPMYLPVLLGGCLLGTWWGLGVGLASPLASFALTSAFGEAMPAAARGKRETAAPIRLSGGKGAVSDSRKGVK